ncbi:ParA family protein [Paracoccus litorisediminis]|uniref:AAA family ATPase n=1 Tax=Paracoccus litorisediminis TaxID=2006130 RepID=A0A844HUZ6_9RHOB|nr:ParA family protein [Paracoccus litorisediminis]MTH62125.1 AAA family ATPase [Paracoccus litorisediminis]
MKTICVTAQKGGAGKTTLARNLAVAASQDGQRAVLIDLDPQQSLRGWWDSREADEPAMLATDPAPHQLAHALIRLAEDFDLCVIDTPPAAPDWLAEAITLADLALVPVRPSADDLRAVGATIAALERAGTPFAFVLSQAPRAKLTDQTVRALARHGRIAPENIAQRVAYAETAGSGQGVCETNDSKARAEMAGIWSYVRELTEARA